MKPDFATTPGVRCLIGANGTTANKRARVNRILPIFTDFGEFGSV
jgi:hypothetical protein